MISKVFGPFPGPGPRSIIGAMDTTLVTLFFVFFAIAVAVASNWPRKSDQAEKRVEAGFEYGGHDVDPR